MTTREVAIGTVPGGAGQSDAVRDVIGRFATGITVVTTQDAAGDHGMTATAIKLSGFYVVACDEQCAREIAACMPVATHGHVEGRPRVVRIQLGSGMEPRSRPRPLSSGRGR